MGYEIGDLISRDQNGVKISSKKNLGRDFLYLRFNTYLEAGSLTTIGVDGIDSSLVKALDCASDQSIQHLQKIGDAIASQIDLSDFGKFV